MNVASGISLCFDILTVFIILPPVLKGAFKGFRKTAPALIAAAVSIIAAYLISGALAEPIYEKFVRNKVLDYCIGLADEYDPAAVLSQTLSDYGADATDEEIEKVFSSADGFSEAFSSIMQKLSGEDSSEFRQSLGSQAKEQFGLTEEISESEICDVLQAYSESPEAAAELIENRFVRPAASAAISSALFILSVIIVRLLISIAYFIFGFDLKGGADGLADMSGGIILGAIGAAAYFVMFSTAVKSVAEAGFIDLDAIDSGLFITIYNLLY